MMKKLNFFNQALIAVVLAPFFFSSCKEDLVEYNDNNCKAIPQFISRLGFDKKHSYFSTSEKHTMGLVLIEAVEGNNITTGKVKQHQDSSWKTAGWLAPIQIDDKGNIFVGPAPFINVLHNGMKDQNTLYKVDAINGKMQVFVKLPFATEITNNQNPFGIIGLAYLCETNSIYVSSVAGSDRQHERGVIYQVDAGNGKIIDQLEGIDALGMGISYKSGKRELFFGKARSTEVYAIELDHKGKFKGPPYPAFSLVNLGLRGDDKVRKIKTDKNGDVVVYAMEFNFNLIAPGEKQESVYYFFFDEEKKHWTLKQ